MSGMNIIPSLLHFEKDLKNVLRVLLISPRKTSFLGKSASFLFS